MTRQARHRTVIAQKERQIGKLRDEVERLRKILLERDTGTGENRETVLPKTEIPKELHTEKPGYGNTGKPRQGETDEQKTREPMVTALRLLISFWTMSVNQKVMYDGFAYLSR